VIGRALILLMMTRLPSIEPARFPWSTCCLCFATLAY